MTRCVGFSEKDPFAVKTYKANYDTQGEVEMGDLETFTAKAGNITSLPDFDMLTGGFPCQSFSMMGRQEGFKDARGNVFYRIIDILKVKRPLFVLLENVKNLKTHDGGRTMEEILDSLARCGYDTVAYDVFNTADFSLAQTRNRVFIFASRMPLPLTFHFSREAVLESFKPLNGESSVIRQRNILDVLDREVDDRYYLSERIKPTILSNGSKSFVSNSEINQLIARPLTATMVKLHRACQDNYYSDEFLSSSDPCRYVTSRFPKEVIATHRIRRLTPVEAFKLQGFDGAFVGNARSAGVSEHQLYKQAGNAVSVNTVYAILHHLIVRNRILEQI